MKKRVVLDVDDLQLFDMLRKMKGDFPGHRHHLCDG